MGKPTLPNVRLEIDASDVSNLISNHSSQAGVTTGWAADSGYTLATATNPTRSGITLSNTYTGGKALAVTAAAGRSQSATVKSPTFAVVVNQWVGAQISIASNILSQGESKLCVYSAIQYLDLNGNQVGFLGYNIGDLVTEDPNIPGWSTVVFNPRPLQPTGAVPQPATQARLVFKFVRKNPFTEVITTPAETIYLTKAMAVCADNMLKVSNIAFADPGAVYQVITANVTNMASNKGGDINGVEDDMQVGMLTATLRDFDVDPNRNPRIRKNRLMRITSPNTSGVWEPIFTGRLDHMTVKYVDKDNLSKAPVVTLTATDAIADASTTTAFYNYSGTIGQKVRAVIADSGTSIPYVTDAGTASTTKTFVDDNGKLWDQLTMIRNNTVNGKLWVDRTNTIQCKTFTATTPVYTFTDLDRFKLVNQFYGYGNGSAPAINMGYISAADYPPWTATFDYNSGGTPSLGYAVTLTKTYNDFSGIPVRYHPYTGSALSYSTAGAVGAQVGDRVSISIPIQAIASVRVRLTYGGLGSTQTVFTDLQSGFFGNLVLNNITAGENLKGTNGAWTDQVTITVTDFGSDAAWGASGQAVNIGSGVIYNSGKTAIPSATPVNPRLASGIEEWTFTGQLNASPATFYYRPGDYTPYLDADIGFDNKLVVNQLTVTRHASNETDGEKVYGPYLNQASVISWGRVTANVDIVDGDAATLAADYLKKYQEPMVTPLSVTINYDNKRSNEHLMDLYTPVRFVHSATEIDKTFYVIGIEQRITGTRWTITYNFRPLDNLATVTVTNPPGGPATGPEDIYTNPGGGSGGGGTAATTTFTPAGTVAATNVQTAIQELDTDINTAATTYNVAATTTLTGTATITDIAGATTTVTVGATTDKFLVVVTADIQKTSATATTTTAAVNLLVNGAAPAGNPQAIYRDDSAAINRACVGQSFIVTGLAAGSRIFKLQGLGTGYQFNAVHTTLRIVKL